MHTLRSPLFAAIAIGVSLTTSMRADEAKEKTPTFERDVRPIFKAYCLDCHGGGAELKGKLDLRLARTARRGGKSGPAIVAGQPDESLLMARVQDGEMPPTEKKVPPAQIAVIERWIATGARTHRDEPESLPPGIDITPEERAYWAFQPIRRLDPPPLAARGPGAGAGRRSMPSSWRSSAPRGVVRRRGGPAHAPAPGRRSTSSGCRRRASRSTPSSRMPPPTPTSG